MRGYPIEKEEIDEIVSMRTKDHMSVNEIAESTGKSTATVKRYLTLAGVSTRARTPKGPPLSHRQFAMLIYCRRQGMLSPDVAFFIGATLAEANRAYASGTYSVYIQRR